MRTVGLKQMRTHGLKNADTVLKNFVGFVDDTTIDYIMQDAFFSLKLSGRNKT